MRHECWLLFHSYMQCLLVRSILRLPFVCGEMFFLELCLLVTWRCAVWALLIILGQHLSLEHECVARPGGIQRERERSPEPCSNCCYLCPEQQLPRTDLFFNPDLTDTLGCGSALEKRIGRDSWSLRRFHDICYTDSIPCEIWGARALCVWERESG